MEKCADTARVAQVVASWQAAGKDFSNLWGFLRIFWSQRVKVRPAIGGEKAVLSPQSSVLSPHSSVLSPQSSVLIPQSSVLSPQLCKFGSQKIRKHYIFVAEMQKDTQYFCSKKLDLRHLSRECCENLNIPTLRIKCRFKSAFEDSP